MAGREAEFGVGFSEGREWLGLRRDEEEHDTLFELIGTTWEKVRVQRLDAPLKLGYICE